MRKAIFTPSILAACVICSPALAAAVTDAAAPASAGQGPAASQAADPGGPVVDRDFAAYDLDKSGKLDADEFAAWVTKLRKPAADGASQDPEGWAAGLFARADTDHDQQVSKAEMKTLLSAAAQG